MSVPAPGSAVGTRLSVLMFLQFFVWGSWYASAGNYMRAHGMSDAISWAYTVGPIAALVSPFFLGMVADRYFATERVLGAMHLLGGFAMLAAPAVARATPSSPWPFVGVLLVHMLCYMPTLGLSNTLAFHSMKDQEKQFPLVRVFGTIGWIAANRVVSDALEADASEEQFYVAGAAGLALAAWSLFLPHVPAPAAGKETRVRDVLGLDALALLRERSFALFIVGSFLICVPLAAYYAFAPVFAADAGFAHVASTLSWGQVSEIVFMLLMPLCFARLGVKWMLAVGMFAWVARYAFFAAAWDERVRWMVLAGIVLHGICYDFFFVTGQIYVDKRAHPSIRGQAQGLLVLVTQGLGLGIGAQVAQRLVQSFSSGAGAGAVIDWKSVWLATSAMAGVVLLAFVALFRDAPASAPAAPQRAGDLS